ncbi:hypothetical protein D9619_007595 [Psilocybe cf. subviscida]|uniref:Uncharacterized protein n=1 Tax=Psilocybe cf. subviscida TaxID=2480587 RepID=A0A8H5B291_9AGAR|nr:hypothetical protein D9619_007595 [Psilocybe cf. subviscida]
MSWIANHNAFVVNNSSPTSVIATVNAFPVLVSFLPDFVAGGVSDGCNLYFGIDQATNDPTLLFAGLNQFLSAATTVFATSMIALKIILSTRDCRARYSYTRIIDILVQSAALESLILVVSAISEIALYILGEPDDSNMTLYVLFLEILTYASACRLIVTGIAPTLIAFRVAEERPSTEVDSTRKRSSQSGLAFKQFTRHVDPESPSQQIGVTAIRFGSAQEDDSIFSISSGTGVGEIRVVSRVK